MNRNIVTTTPSAYLTDQHEGFPIRFGLTQTVWSDTRWLADIVVQTGNDFSLTVEEAEKIIEALTEVIKKAQA